MYFACIHLTHVTIVESPRDIGGSFSQGAPVLCVVYVVIDESPLLACSSLDQKCPKNSQTIIFCINTQSP